MAVITSDSNFQRPASLDLLSVCNQNTVVERGERTRVLWLWCQVVKFTYSLENMSVERHVLADPVPNLGTCSAREKQKTTTERRRQSRG